MKRPIVMVFLSVIVACSRPSTPNATPQQLAVIKQLKWDYDQGYSTLNEEAKQKVENWVGFIKIQEEMEKLQDADLQSIEYSLKSLRDACLSIQKEPFPDPLHQPPVLSRLRVFETFVGKADAKNPSERLTQDFKDDLFKMVEAYNALINQMNILTEATIEQDNLQIIRTP